MITTLTKTLFMGGILGMANIASGAVAISSLSGETTLSTGVNTRRAAIGYNITIGSQDLLVTALGYYKPDNGVAFVDPNAVVGIFEFVGVNGNLLGSVMAGSAQSSYQGEYSFVDLSSPITLLANTSYRVMANTGMTVSNNDHNIVPLDGTPSGGAGFTIGTSDFLSPGRDDLALGTSTGGSSLFLGSFEYTVVPEPSVAFLGLLSLGCFLRRRR